jgi:DNA-binding NarL/FixJ family response regulator
VASALGQAERGATLLGSAEALRERIGLRFRVKENEIALGQAVATARTALDEQLFAAAWSAGRNHSTGEAVAAALEPLLPRATATGIALTPRELEVLRLLVAGLTDPAIAGELFISVRTVENHAARIFVKLDVRTRTAAATAAIASGLVDATYPRSA